MDKLFAHNRLTDTTDSTLSIEEWLGDNTQAYYAILAETGQGHWNPGRSALEWVRSCLRAHYFQAARVIRRAEEYSAVYTAIYVVATGEKPHTAGRDLRYLADRGWLVPRGEKRGRKYERSQALVELRAKHRLPRTLTDPYALVAEGLKSPRLPGL